MTLLNYEMKIAHFNWISMEKIYHRAWVKMFFWEACQLQVTSRSFEFPFTTLRNFLPKLGKPPTQECKMPTSGWLVSLKNVFAEDPY